MKSKKTFILKLIILFVVLLGCTGVIARYVLNSKKSINVLSNDSNVDISIDKTVGNIVYETEEDTFNVTIKNNNEYQITYSVKNAESRMLAKGEVTSAVLDANSEVVVPITLYQDTNIYYTTFTDPAGIVVDIEKPYKLASKKFDLTINTSNYNLEELIFAFNAKGTGTPDFSQNINTLAGSGIYTMADESGTSSYFRGVINNNYVKFADKIWRVMRINGDGSYRLILNNAIGSSLYVKDLSTTYNDVGYMYSTSSNPRGNTTDSEVKKFVDNWYANNLTTYDNYMYKDGIFWNDRTTVSTSSNETIYAGWKRIVDHAPSIKPTVVADMFSVTTAKGNGKLTYPIGLITADEVVLSGGTMTGLTDLKTYAGTHWANRENYLNLTAQDSLGMWTMTPRRFSTSSSSLMIVSKPQAIIYSEPSYFYDSSKGYARTREVKPVINVKASVMCKGTGTAADPFLVRAEK